MADESIVTVEDRMKRNKTLTFRLWCNEIWFEHCDEFEGWFHRRPDYTMREYFNKYKWWLKREYKYRRSE